MNKISLITFFIIVASNIYCMEHSQGMAVGKKNDFFAEDISDKFAANGISIDEEGLNFFKERSVLSQDRFNHVVDSYIDLVRKINGKGLTFINGMPKVLSANECAQGKAVNQIFRENKLKINDPGILGILDHVFSNGDEEPLNIEILKKELDETKKILVKFQAKTKQHVQENSAKIQENKNKIGSLLQRCDQFETDLNKQESRLVRLKDDVGQAIDQIEEVMGNEVVKLYGKSEQIQKNLDIETKNIKKEIADLKKEVVTEFANVWLNIQNNNKKFAKFVKENQKAVLFTIPVFEIDMTSERIFWTLCASVLAYKQYNMQKQFDALQLQINGVKGQINGTNGQLLKAGAATSGIQGQLKTLMDVNWKLLNLLFGKKEWTELPAYMQEFNKLDPVAYGLPKKAVDILKKK